MSQLRNFTYEDIDGIHWSDTPKGSELIYAINFGDWLFIENDMKVSASYKLPEELVSTLEVEDDYTGYIKIRADKVGSHKVECTLVSTENNISQTKVIPIILKVY